MENGQLKTPTQRVTIDELGHGEALDWLIAKLVFPEKDEEDLWVGVTPCSSDEPDDWTYTPTREPKHAQWAFTVFQARTGKCERLEVDPLEGLRRMAKHFYGSETDIPQYIMTAPHKLAVFTIISSNYTGQIFAWAGTAKRQKPFLGNRKVITEILASSEEAAVRIWQTTTGAAKKPGL